MLPTAVNSLVIIAASLSWPGLSCQCWWYSHRQHLSHIPHGLLLWHQGLEYSGTRWCIYPPVQEKILSSRWRQRSHVNNEKRNCGGNVRSAQGIIQRGPGRVRWDGVMVVNSAEAVQKEAAAIIASYIITPHWFRFILFHFKVSSSHHYPHLHAIYELAHFSTLEQNYYHWYI